MLNEGINLSDCRIGIYAVLNSSEILIKQKLGRILRHEKPIVIIPYYKNTREEEIVNNNMLLEYDPKLVKIIKSVNEIVL
jgi:superfamily II DNA or RNA helicase